MTQLTMVDTEATQNVEERLWSRYIMALLDADRIALQYEKAWRLHVMCDDTETGLVWSALTTKWQNARDHAEALRQEWKRVAYPMFGWPLPDEDKK
jgi:hypothetical protein